MQTSHEYLYQASKAGLLMSTEINTDGISILWKGFNQTIKDYVLQTIQNMLDLPRLDQGKIKKLFIESQKALLKDWNNLKYNKSYRQALNLFPQLMQNDAMREADLLPILEKYNL